MIRAWIAVALLAGSWLLGLSYYHTANPPAWVVAVAVGTLLLRGAVDRLPGRGQIAVALALLVPPAWFAAWPYRAAPLLIAGGLALQVLPLPRRWLQALGPAAVAAGTVMLAQWVALALYTACTARCHELPWPLPALLEAVARLLGIDAAADGTNIAMHSMRQLHGLGATWDLLVDPASFCFLVGGLVMLGLAAWARLPSGKRWTSWAAPALTLLLVLVVWLPIRAGLMMAIYLQRDLHSDYEAPLHVMNHFLCPWVHLLLLAGPVLLAWRFVRLPLGELSKSGESQETARAQGATPGGQAARWHYPAAVALLVLAVAVFTVAVYWDPVGKAKAGRVMFVERHSTWEPTTRRYDTTWYGEPSGYNYAALYDYCARYFDMAQLLESDAIDNQKLAACDVLVIKIPTARYTPQEVEAVVRFVERGGGLLLIGEHTNFSKCGTYLNDIARRFGFAFRYDLLFGMDVAYDQAYRRPAVPHPIVRYVPPMEFAVSCSIEPGWSCGRAVIQSTGLWSLPPEYNSENYFPVPEHHAEMRYGAFIQLWATCYGRGRVAAFTDSTIFSNFSTFEPGQAEMMLGMFQWLNHRSLLGDPRWWLLGLGLVPLAAALLLARRHGDGWLVLLAAGTCGFALAGGAVAAAGRWAMPSLQPRRPMVWVVIDRTVSDVPLAKGGFIRGEGEGYGMLEQWIPRLGYFTKRCSGPEAFSGAVLLVICPSRSVPQEFRENLVHYVAAGGKLLVLDSPENAATTANSLLWPFGLSVRHNQAWKGQLSLSGGGGVIPVERVCEVSGGQPVARLGEKPVAARVRYGEGSVMAVGFGSLLNDRNMGWHWNLEPDEPTRARYDVLFALLRGLVEDQPMVIPQRAPSTAEQPAATAAGAKP